MSLLDAGFEALKASSDAKDKAAPTPTEINSPHVVKPAPPTTTAAPVTARFSQIGNGGGVAGTVTVRLPAAGSGTIQWKSEYCASGPSVWKP